MIEENLLKSLANSTDFDSFKEELKKNVVADMEAELYRIELELQTSPTWGARTVHESISIPRRDLLKSVLEQYSN